jgi:hypothetical protein
MSPTSHRRFLTVQQVRDRCGIFVPAHFYFSWIPMNARNLSGLNLIQLVNPSPRGVFSTDG